MSDLQTGLARCYRHPMRETGVRCVRCNRPICPDCMRPASVGFMCPDDVRLGNATIRRPRTVVGARVPRSAAPVVSWSLVGVNVAVFLATFLVARTVVLLIMLRLVPKLYLQVGGTHVHHLNYGIALLSVAGGWILLGDPAGAWLRAAAVVYAVGLALT